MKSTGIVRKLDELGRITLPIELRRTLGVSERDPLEIFVEGERIILSKYSKECKCGSKENLTEVHGILLCKNCLEEALAKLQN